MVPGDRAMLRGVDAAAHLCARTDAALFRRIFEPHPGVSSEAKSVVR
jgi:hypothetical protein